MWIVIYSDYDERYDVKGFTSDYKVAEKCKEFYDYKTKNIDYGHSVEIVEVEDLGNYDFDAMIRLLKSEELAKKEMEKEKIKKEELELIEKLRKKYGV